MHTYRCHIYVGPELFYILIMSSLTFEEFSGVFRIFYDFFFSFWNFLDFFEIPVLPLAKQLLTSRYPANRSLSGHYPVTIQSLRLFSRRPVSWSRAPIMIRYVYDFVKLDSFLHTY